MLRKNNLSYCFMLSVKSFVQANNLIAKINTRSVIFSFILKPNISTKHSKHSFYIVFYIVFFI